MHSLRHGMVETPTYMTWHGMKERCTNPNHKNFETYGKIDLCPKWFSFVGFFEDMGERPQG